VDQLPPEILPGMTTDVAIEVAQKEKALLVPVRAINSGHVLVQKIIAKKKLKWTLVFLMMNGLKLREVHCKKMTKYSSKGNNYVFLGFSSYHRS